VSRFCAILLGVVIGASVTQAEWPIPTADGTTWQYALTREGETEPETLTRQVFAPRNADEQNTLRIETAINSIAHSTEFLTNEGKAVLATAQRSEGGSTEAFNPPITILPADLNFGAEWKYRGPVAGLDLNLPLKIVGEGEIEVPAGKFRALHFRGEKNDGFFTVADLWFVGGVGSIKETVTQRSPSGDLLNRNTIELVKLPALRRTREETGSFRFHQQQWRSTPCHFSRCAANRGALAWSWPAKKRQDSRGLDCARHRRRAN